MMKRNEFLAVVCMTAGSLLMQGAMAESACASKSGNVRDGKPLKVLMVGNSFSVCVLKQMPRCAADAGQVLDLASLFIGGCPLKKHWGNIKKSTDPDFKPYTFSYNYASVKAAKDAPVAKLGRKTNIPQALQADKWDIVTIQQASHYSWREESYHPHGDRLVEKIRELSPKAEIWVQETWSYTPWDSRLKAWGMDQNEMYRKLHAAYAAFAGKHSLKVIPMGTAVQNWRRDLPVEYAENSLGGDVVGGGKLDERDHFRRNQDNTWSIYCDPFHLGRKGEFFQALVWAKAPFGADLGKVKVFPGFISHAEGELMKKVAAETVFD
jgi:hypothetical protein